MECLYELVIDRWLQIGGRDKELSDVFLCTIKFPTHSRFKSLHEEYEIAKVSWGERSCYQFQIGILQFSRRLDKNKSMAFKNFKNRKKLYISDR